MPDKCRCWVKQQHLRETVFSPCGNTTYEAGFSQHEGLKASLSKGTSQKYRWVSLNTGIELWRGGRRRRWLGEAAAIPQAALEPVLLCTGCAEWDGNTTTPHTSSRKGDLKKCNFCTKSFSTGRLLHMLPARTQPSSPLWKENGLLTTPLPILHSTGISCTGEIAQDFLSWGHKGPAKGTSIQHHEDGRRKSSENAHTAKPRKRAYMTTMASSSLWPKPVLLHQGQVWVTTGIRIKAPI